MENNKNINKDEPIKYDSVLVLMKLKSIVTALVFLFGTASSISLIVLGANAKDNSKAMYIVLGLVSVLLTILAGYITYTLFNFFISKRTENIDYMNERLDRCDRLEKILDSKKEDK